MEKRRKLRLLKDWKNNKDHVFWIIKQGKAFRKYTLGFLAVSFLGMIISLGSSIAGKYVVDAATGFETKAFWQYIIIMLVTTVISIALSFFAALFGSFVSEKFAFKIRADMFDRVQRSRWYDVTRFHSADMLSRLTGDVNTLAGSIITIVPTVIVAALELLIVAAILLYYDPVMALIGFIVGPLGLIAGTAFRRRFVEYQKKLRESESQYYSFFQEALANLSVMKTFQREDYNNHYFENLRSDRLSLVMKSSRLSAFMGVMMKLVYSIGYVAAFSWCAYRLSKSDGSYTYGTMTLFLSLVSLLQGTIRSLGGVIPQMFTTVVAAKRLRQITDIPNEEYGKTTHMPEKVGVKLENVSFSYDKDMVLNHINAEVKDGERIGIIGSSGAGKTTLIRLLLSLVSPTEGKACYVFENGEKEEISTDSRRFISYVPQGNTLISGTVRSNLLMAKPDADEDEMWHALELASAKKFVSKNPLGLDTVISEKAGGLSEGQAQRISIARAILRNKPVLILDEATSALDEDTEREIFLRLTGIGEKTCFIITHRKSMLKYCHRVFKIDSDGTIRIKENKEINQTDE